MYDVIIMLSEFLQISIHGYNVHKMASNVTAWPFGICCLYIEYLT